MQIDRELNKLLCITQMGEIYFKKWESIKNLYAPLLDKIPIYRPVAYTHHDFSHHCYNIYRIVSQTILRNPQLSEQEWFVLNTAILLHDISMTEINFNRLIHSKQSADWLKKHMEEKKEKVLIENLNESEAEAIELIIKAHSDCKKVVNGKEVIIERTMEDVAMQEPMDCNGAQDVKVKFLAALLRIADECDVTRSRLGTDDFEKLDESDVEQKYSKEQWLQLKCFKKLVRSGEDLVLDVDDQYVNNYTGAKADIEHRIKKVVIKIRKQLKYVRQQAITEDEYLAMFPLRNVVICSGVMDDDYIKSINEGLFELEESSRLVVNILNDSLEEEISIKIDEENLTIPGHYIVTENHCERDWIDLRDIVVDKVLSNKIINLVVNEIKDDYLELGIKPLIVAMEDNGLILASQIAYRLGIPFSYVIPKNFNQKRSSEKEESIDFKSYDKIIIITDAVATFQTLGETCKYYKLFDKICKIYTVLYREPFDKKFYHEDAEMLMTKLTACCGKYGMEVHWREKCDHNKHGKCTALNK